MRFFSRPLAALAASAAFTSAAFAHGPQIQLTNDGNKIVTRNLFLDEPYRTTLSPVKSVYVMPLVPRTTTPGTEWDTQPNTNVRDATGTPYTSGPGFAYGYGWTYDTSSSTYTSTFPIRKAFTLTALGGLQRWNGSAFVNTNLEQLQLVRGETFETATETGVTGGADSSVLFTPITAPTGPAALDKHSSVSYRLLGQGAGGLDPFAATRDGVYLATFEMSINDAGIAKSDPFSFVVYKNAPLSDVQAAVGQAFPNASAVQFVPEPAGAGLLLILSAPALLRRRS